MEERSKEMDEAQIIDKGEKMYIEEKDFKGKNKLYVCSIVTGEAQRIIPEKEYVRRTDVKDGRKNTIHKRHFVYSRPDLFYMTAKTLTEAVSKFEQYFAQLSKKLEEKQTAKEK